MRPFLICIHDATPAYARETRVMVAELSPLVGRKVSFGVVPNWHNEWPLAEHADYCKLIHDSANELLLHGYFHRRRNGRGLTSMLAEQSDEMNGLDALETRRIIERGQRDLADTFGKSARGFLAPAWQRGHVTTANMSEFQIEYVLGFFSLDSQSGRRIPLATFTWDCGRWGWLGHIGHAVGWTLQSLDRGIPVLAIHPRDIERGYWPTIVRLVHELLDKGYEPTTSARLLDMNLRTSDVEVTV